MTIISGVAAPRTSGTRCPCSAPGSTARSALIWIMELQHHRAHCARGHVSQSLVAVPMDQRRCWPRTTGTAGHHVGRRGDGVVAASTPDGPAPRTIQGAMGSVLTGTSRACASVGQARLAGTVVRALMNVEITLYFIVEVVTGRTRSWTSSTAFLHVDLRRLVVADRDLQVITAISASPTVRTMRSPSQSVRS